MSDQVITLIPEDPHFVPTLLAREAAVELLRTLAPESDDITSGLDQNVSFHDCGANFERVRCPHCGREIDVETWQDWMTQDYSETEGFRLDAFETPCCGKEAKLNELRYEAEQGFSRYCLTARTPGTFPSALIGSVEQAVGCKLRVIRQHL